MQKENHKNCSIAI